MQQSITIEEQLRGTWTLNDTLTPFTPNEPLDVPLSETNLIGFIFNSFAYDTLDGTLFIPFSTFERLAIFKKGNINSSRFKTFFPCDINNILYSAKNKWRSDFRNIIIGTQKDITSTIKVVVLVKLEGSSSTNWIEGYAINELKQVSEKDSKILLDSLVTWLNANGTREPFTKHTTITLLGEDKYDKLYPTITGESLITKEGRYATVTKKPSDSKKLARDEEGALWYHTSNLQVNTANELERIAGVWQFDKNKPLSQFYMIDDYIGDPQEEQLDFDYIAVKGNFELIIDSPSSYEPKIEKLNYFIPLNVVWDYYTNVTVDGLCGVAKQSGQVIRSYTCGGLNNLINNSPDYLGVWADPETKIQLVIKGDLDSLQFKMYNSITNQEASTMKDETLKFAFAEWLFINAKQLKVY